MYVTLQSQRVEKSSISRHHGITRLSNSILVSIVVAHLRHVPFIYCSLFKPAHSSY